MSLPRRIALSFMIILMLSLSSIIVHLWANDIRQQKVQLLQAVIRTQALVSDFGQQVLSMNKRIRAVHAFRETSNINLSEAEATDLEARIESLRLVGDELEVRLAEYVVLSGAPGVREESSLYIGPLFEAWLLVVRNKNEGELPALTADASFQAVNTRIDIAESLLLGRSNDINRQLDTVVGLTDRVALGVFIAAVIITFGLAYHLTRYTRASIGALQEGTDQWGRGNLEFQLPQLGQDEFGRLANSFNAMASNLQAAMAKVREASVRADAANKAKSSFLANMSHELRTPMNAIIGYSEMMMEDIDDDPQISVAELAPDLQRIQTAGKHLLALINDILDISKVESGKMTVHNELVQLRPVLEDVLTTASPLVSVNDNRLSVDLNFEQCELNTDVTKLRQILINLLSNAGKFTHQGEIRLRGRIVSAEAGEKQVELTVSDTGIGMDAPQLERIFEAFEQADSSTTRKFGGTGLGLAISRSFAELMGGTLTATSKPGVGSDFRLCLPLLNKPVAQLRGGSDAQLPCILVIDDDPVARDLTLRTLDKAGYQVELSASGMLGLERAREIHPKLIVLDVMMPGMDGWQVLRELRSAPETREIPVLMHSMLNQRELGLANGADDFLTKPLNKTLLIEKVEALLT